jgi:hypothetical protein
MRMTDLQAWLQVTQMGQYLSIRLNEHAFVWEVAELAVCAPLPPDWVQEAAGPDGQDQIWRLVKNTHTHSPRVAS